MTYPEKVQAAVSSSEQAVSALSSRVDKIDQDLAKRDRAFGLLAKQVVDLTTEVQRLKTDANDAKGG